MALLRWDVSRVDLSRQFDIPHGRSSSLSKEDIRLAEDVIKAIEKREIIDTKESNVALALDIAVYSKESSDVQKWISSRMAEKQKVRNNSFSGNLLSFKELPTAQNHSVAHTLGVNSDIVHNLWSSRPELKEGDTKQQIRSGHWPGGQWQYLTFSGRWWQRNWSRTTARLTATAAYWTE